MKIIEILYLGPKQATNDLDNPMNAEDQWALKLTRLEFQVKSPLSKRWLTQAQAQNVALAKRIRRKRKVQRFRVVE